jgi:hypothetical protein
MVSGLVASCSTLSFEQHMTPRRVLVAIALVISGLIAALAAGLIPRLWNMKAEYVTAGVIRDTEEYVVRSNGRWPQSWADLGEDRSRYTNINFAIDPDSSSKADVGRAIRPVSGKFLTYPHADRDLERLFATMRRVGVGKLEPTDAMDSR